MHDQYTGANIRVGFCIQNAKSAQYHKDRAKREFRLPQNSTTICFICKESSGGMTSFKNRGLFISVLPKRGSGWVNKACIQSIVCVVYAEIPNRNVGVCGLLSIVCVDY